MKEEQGAICGGVMNESTFFSDVEAHIMSFYMSDEKFEHYKKLVKLGNKKEIEKYFDSNARNFIKLTSRRTYGNRKMLKVRQGSSNDGRPCIP